MVKSEGRMVKSEEWGEERGADRPRGAPDSSSPPPPRLHPLQPLRAALSPWVELVGREPLAPRVHRLVALLVEPVRAPQLVVRLQQVRPERQRLEKEVLRVL